MASRSERVFSTEFSVADEGKSTNRVSAAIDAFWSSQGWAERFGKFSGGVG